jgi:hypothetical protein
VKFILNTAIDPHFCVLFDEDNNLLHRQEWTHRRRDGIEIFEFLETHLPSENAELLSFIGGVSGPGGFSSLRAGAGVLNALAFAHKIPIHHVRADIWIRSFLAEHGQNENAFVLNSFSEGVFVPQKDKLIRMNVSQAALEIQYPVFDALLPESKRSFFPQKINISFQNSEHSLLRSLLNCSPSESFLPDYEFPPV